MKTASLDDDLLVLHNLTANNLKHALRFGGLASPSVAIARKDAVLGDYGAISLIGDGSLVDPSRRDVKVFASDVYSMRYPDIARELSLPAVNRLLLEMQPLKQAGLPLPDADSLATDSVLNLSCSLAWQAYCLISHGVAPALHAREPSINPLRKARLIKHGLGKYLDCTDVFKMIHDPEFVELAMVECRSSYEGHPELASHFQKITRDPQAARNVVDRLAYSIVNDARAARFPEVDSFKSGSAVKRQLVESGLYDSLEAFVEQKLEGITVREVIVVPGSHGRKMRRLEHTLQNVVTVMKGSVRGGDTFDYGAGSVRAHLTPEFKSLSHINAAKGQLTVDFGPIKTASDERLLSLAQAMKVRTETAQYLLVEAGKGSNALGAAMKACGVGDWHSDAIMEFADELRIMPAAYFEAKPLRVVGLGEFVAAAVPHNIQPELVEGLRSAGLANIEAYKDGDMAGRTRVVNQLHERAVLHGQRMDGSLASEVLSSSAMPQRG